MEEVINNIYQKAKLIALELWVVDSLNQLNDLLIYEILFPERSGKKKLRVFKLIFIVFTETYFIDNIIIFIIRRFGIY